METALWLWVGFTIGLLARWGDRIQFVISEGEEGKTIGGFLRANWIRLSIRALVGAYVFGLMVAEGWIVNQVIAFSTGFGFDTILESFLDRAKGGAESVLRKMGG